MAALMTERQESFNTVRPHLEYLSRRELACKFPPTERVRSSWERMSAGIAVEVVLFNRTKGTPQEAALRGIDPKVFKDDLIWEDDGFAAERLARGFSLEDWMTYVAACEGHKEKKAKKLNREPKMLKGYYGWPSQFEIDVDLDPIEGTDATADNRPGGMVFGAISTARGIMLTPIDEVSLGGKGEDIDYMEKLFAPKGLVGRVSLEQSPLENLYAAKRHYGVDSSQIYVTYLNRPRNQAVIDAIQEFGATGIPIKAGDLAPSLRAGIEPEKGGRVDMVMGSGGLQEGVGAAAAMKQWGAVAEGRLVRERVDGDKELYIPDPRVLTIDDIISGEAEHSMAIFAAITDIPEFGMKGVDLGKGVVQTFAVDPNYENGYRIKHFAIHELMAD